MTPMPCTDSAMSQGTPLTDRELLSRRFALARRVRSFVRVLGHDYEREQARIDLEACEAECRRRGLLSS